MLGSPPLAFTFGLGGLLLFPMWAGASVYFPEGPQSPERVVELLQTAGITILYTAPTFYRKMAPLAKARGVGRLAQCVSAGEALPDATRQLWRDASGIDIIDGIGATEMFHIFISSAGDDIRAGAIGRVVPRLPRQGRGPGRPASAARHRRPTCRDRADRLPLLERRAPAALCEGRLELSRRRIHAGCGRLLLLPGARRRHDRLGRLQHRRPGSRGGAADASGGRRMRGDRPARCRTRNDREGRTAC